MTPEELNKACEALDKVYFASDEARNKAKEIVRKAMGAVVKESLTANLTWEDIRRIVEIADQMIQTAHDRVEWEDKSEEEYYTEVLRRFKEERK